MPQESPTSAAAAMNGRLTKYNGCSLLTYSGPPVATPATPVGVGNTLLVTFVVPNPAAPAATIGTLTFNAIPPAVAVASGTVGFVRVVDALGNALEDLYAPPYGSDLTMSPSLTVTAGTTVSVVGLTASQP